MTLQDSPKTFVSHASEDKDRFVLDFATRLRSKGVDAWLDKWEMLPGDSLVDKLFEEGIASAAAIIVVLSKVSVLKPWVREELNAAMVKRIEKGSRLIPVVIDDCEIPECLKSTVWIKIENLEDYSDELESIVAAIFGTTSKPPLGEPPAYTRFQRIGKLEDIDTVVLRAFGEAAIEGSSTQGLSTHRAWEASAKEGVARGDFLDSLEILSQERYLEKGRTVGQPPPDHSITHFGLEQYLKADFERYSQVRLEIVSSIVNENDRSNKQIAEKLAVPIAVVDHVLDNLEANGHIRLMKVLGGLHQVQKVSPSLGRALRDGSTS